jgi:predicted GIY-YIG superfamily endonuclease
MTRAILYIVRCNDDSYYVGTTRTELEIRIAQHNDGTFGGCTSKRRPVRLVFSQEFERITDAIEAERKVKGWSRAKKEALIAGRFDDLKALSKRRTPFPSSFETPAARAPQDEEKG